MAKPILDVCICTHNPRRDVFALVLDALARQEAEKDLFRVLIIDNASEDPIRDVDCVALAKADVSYAVIREPRLGTVFARSRAVSESNNEWVLFVDDDTELAVDYISVGLSIIAKRKDLGCFGGKLKLPDTLKPPSWTQPFLPNLAIRDYGEEEIVRVADHWGEWEPAAAGAFVHRSVLEIYQNRVEEDPDAHLLGAKGRYTLNRCEDSLMMLGSHKVGLANSYQPLLTLTHHLEPNRFYLRYLSRLMWGYGRSIVILDRLCGRSKNRNKRNSITDLLRVFKRFLPEAFTYTTRYAICMSALRLGSYLELGKNSECAE